MFFYRAVIQYDGSNFFGWQSQPSGNTVQDEITKAVNKISGEDISLTGAGRTDSGVHALGQVASFQLLKEVNLKKFSHSLNSVLPSNISVINIEKSDQLFHPRFDAKSRVYYYLISNIKSPFFDRYSYLYPPIKKYEIGKLNLLSAKLIGSNNFSAFCRVKTDTSNKICNVFSTHWRKKGNLTLFRIEADRFLHGMVRTIIGTILKAYNTDDAQDYVTHVLSSKDRKEAGEAVPAKGLFLYKVNY